MSRRSIVCSSVVVDSYLEIKSPSVGLARLFVEKGQVVKSGQRVGIFFQLNNRFDLMLGPNSAGIVIGKKDHHKEVPLYYKETFLTIDKRPFDWQKNESEKSIKEKVSASLQYVESPMEGMFYLAPSPSDPPFVKLGDEIGNGQTLGLIEVMKCFYPLKYKGAFKVRLKKILVKNQSPVSLGTKLFAVQ